MSECIITEGPAKGTFGRIERTYRTLTGEMAYTIVLVWPGWDIDPQPYQFFEGEFVAI